MSDHGWKLGEFGLWGKHTILHADLHVPLVIRHPTRTAFPGAHSHAVVELVDLFPTLAVLAQTGRPLPPDLDGQALTRIIYLGPRRRADGHTVSADGGKSVAVAQYSPFTFRNGGCMAYTVIGRSFALKRWVSYGPERCALEDEVDVHRIAATRPGHAARQTDKPPPARQFGRARNRGLSAGDRRPAESGPAEPGAGERRLSGLLDGEQTAMELAISFDLERGASLGGSTDPRKAAGDEARPPFSRDQLVRLAPLAWPVLERVAGWSQAQARKAGAYSAPKKLPGKPPGKRTGQWKEAH